MRIDNGRQFLMVGSVLMAALWSAGFSRGACIPQNLATPAPRDPVARVLARQTKCPTNAIEFSAAFKQMGARLEPTMVNFVGFHNPAPGAFFFFEIASNVGATVPADLTIQRGDLLFGHFTA